MNDALYKQPMTLYRIMYVPFRGEKQQQKLFIFFQKSTFDRCELFE